VKCSLDCLLDHDVWMCCKQGVVVGQWPPLETNVLFLFLVFWGGFSADAGNASQMHLKMCRRTARVELAICIVLCCVKTMVGVFELMQLIDRDVLLMSEFHGW